MTGRLIGIAVALIATLPLLIGTAGDGRATHSESSKPIIAGLMAEPETYDGKAVLIYGLVIDASDEGKVFFLQDVSQMPLKIVGRDDLTARIGDQLQVFGTFFRNGSGPYLKAQHLMPTKVLGGGGCC